MSRGAVFVDRDGVINELVADPMSGLRESPLHVDDVVLMPRAAVALRRLHVAGWPLIGVSNQPAAAKATITLDELEAVQARVIALLATEQVVFDDFRLCLHHPDGVVPELTGACDCRKPAPGMLLDAAAAAGIEPMRSWMIGDTDADVIAGQAAGCRTVLVTTPGSAHKRAGASSPTVIVGDLDAAVTEILRARGVQ